MNRISGWSRTALVLTLALSAVVMVSQAAFAGNRTVIWETGGGRVALIPQDSGSAVPVTPNSHPAELSEDLIIGLLGSIEVRDTLKEKPGPLFTEGSLQLMAPYLQQAFREAGSGDDVSFVVVGLYKTMLGFANRALVTSGRLFYANGKLNLVLGVVKQDIRYRSDGSEKDFRLIATGYRQTVSQGEWSLVPSVDQPFELPRRDWVVLDPKVAFVAKSVVESEKSSTPAAKPARKGADRPLTERLATLNDLKDKGFITEDEYKTKRREIMNEKEPERTAAERLATLNELKAKKLITEDEYRAMRMQIISDL